MAGLGSVGTDLSGKRAVVTGAASGIGLAIARHLGDLGADVVLSDLEGDRLDAAVAVTPRATGLAADLSVRSEVHSLAARSGPIDVLVNNAGLQHVSPIEDFDEARFDLLQAVMLAAPFMLIRALIPGMYERGWGRVINISSVHGLVASPYKSAYVAAKHGVIGITKAIALEAAARSHDVTVHAICPSYVRTPLVEGQVADQAKAHAIPEEEVIEKVILTQNAIKRLIEPADVARAVEFLCSDMAWTMTGSALAMDAGWLAH